MGQHKARGGAASGVAAAVFGAVERVACNDTVPACPSDGYWLFNSVFGISSNGSIVAKYHKAHLFSESVCLDAAPVASTVFALPIGGSTVRIGLLDCYDIEFNASVNAALQAGVDVLVLPMQWMNTVPVSSAQALVQGASWYYNTTILAVGSWRT